MGLPPGSSGSPPRQGWGESPGLDLLMHDVAASDTWKEPRRKRQGDRRAGGPPPARCQVAAGRPCRDEDSSRPSSFSKPVDRGPSPAKEEAERDHIARSPVRHGGTKRSALTP